MHLLLIVKEIDNEPQGILLISSVLKQAGHQVSLVVATEEDPVEAALHRKVCILRRCDGETVWLSYSTILPWNAVSVKGS